MKYIKAVAIEFLLYLYIAACCFWLVSHLFELKFDLIYPFGLALLIALGLAVSKSCLGSLLVRSSQQKPIRNPLWKYEVWLAVLISFAMGWMLVQVKPRQFFQNFDNTFGILSGVFNPNPKYLIPMLQALIETIYLALMATVFAIPFAFVLSFFAAKNLMGGSILGKTVYILIRTVSTIFRSIEAIVWAIIFVVWVGIGPFAGMLALWIHSIASLIKLYSEQIENIDPGPVEAIKATGASTLQIWRYAVAPQILAPYLAFTIYRWDINVRMATIVGFVGGGGIGLMLYQHQQMMDWRNVGLIMWLIALVVWVMDMLSGYLRAKLVNN